jgi:hypothetical protein
MMNSDSGSNSGWSCGYDPEDDEEINTPVTKHSSKDNQYHLLGGTFPYHIFDKVTAIEK